MTEDIENKHKKKSLLNFEEINQTRMDKKSSPTLENITP